MTDDKREPMRDSGEWYRKAPRHVLQAQVDGNMPGGRAHDHALAELKRRDARTEQRAQRIWIKRTFWVTVALGIAGIAAALAR